MAVTTRSGTSERRLIFEMAMRPDLQGMRAVAVLAVVTDHLVGWPTGGFVGVDVFFVLSGFFITGLLLRDRSQTGEVSFKDFYIRRVKRILPSGLLVLTVTVAAAHLLLPASRAKEALQDALWASVFAANIRFEAVGADYFQQDLPPSPVQHYWSLSIEEQFYLVWPLLLVGIFAVTRKLYRRGNLWARHGGLFAAMALIVTASFAWATYLSGANPNGAYFSTTTRVWELGVGALVAIAGPWLARIPTAVRPRLAYAGLAGIGVSLLAISATTRFPAPWAALPVLSTALVIASFHGAEVRGVPMLTHPVARWFGDTSYTLYLWHWPVIVLLPALVPEGPAFYALALVLALGLTAATYYLYEDPIRRSQWLLEKPGRDRPKVRLLTRPVTAFVGLVLAAVAVTSILYINQAEKLAEAQAEVAAASYTDLAPPLADVPQEASAGPDAPPALPVVPGNDPCFGAPAIVDDACALRNPDEPLQPSIDEFATEWGGPSCWTESKAPLRSCTYGHEGPDAVRIALVGDSHAGRVLHGLAPYLTGNRWHLTTFIGHGCVWKSPPTEHCTAMGTIQEELVAQRFDLVLTTSTRTGDADEYPRAWEPVVAAGSRIAVLADNPKASEQSIACLTRVGFGEDRSGECETPKARAMPQDPQVTAARAVEPQPHVIDLTPYYCEGDRCPAVIGDVIVYADVSSHVTPSYWRTLAPALVNGIRRALA